MAAVGGRPDGPALPMLHGPLAGWFHLLTAPEKYAAEAQVYLGLLEEASDSPPCRVLELSGGGNNASHLKRRLELALTDLSPTMLEVSARLNPDCEHLVGDMRWLRLGPEFDAVFAHDAVVHLTLDGRPPGRDGDGLRPLPAGRRAVFVPDFVSETFAPQADHGGRDPPDGRGLRYLAWVWDPGPADSTYVVDFAYLLREADGTVRAVPDRHTLGLVAGDVWLSLLGDAGFRPARRRVALDEGGEVDVFIGRRPR